MNNFHYAEYLANELYNIDIDDARFEELGLIAFGLIGNKRARTYRYQTKTEDKCIQLPCNFIELESVTGDYEDWNRTSNLHVNGDINSHITEQYVESSKRETNQLYQSGRFLKYEKIGNKLYFDQDYPEVNILYKGGLVDDDGLPQITNSEALAIAAFVGYTVKLKSSMVSQNKADFEFSTMIKNEWNLRCDQARVPEYISQNDMDKILDAKTSWNRKSFGKSLKPVI